MSHIAVDKSLPRRSRGQGKTRWQAYKRAMKVYRKEHGARKFHRNTRKPELETGE